MQLGDGGSSVADAADDPRFGQLRDLVAADLKSHNVPGAQLAVVLDGQLRFHAEFGVKKAGGADPVTPDSLFILASISKMFTAATAMKEVEKGTVDLSAPITHAVPWFQLPSPDDPSKITLDQLLSHTSGYPDSPYYTVGYQPTTWDDSAPDALSQMFRTLGKVPLYSPPGAVWNYSNFGFALAGLALSEATHQQFADLVSAEILTPAGMQHATYDTSAASTADHVTGASTASGQPLLVEPSDYASVSLQPYGGLYATASDLGRFAEVLLGRPGVLSANSVARMTSPLVDMHTPNNSYGYGLFVHQFAGETAVWHDGGLEGFQTSLWMLPARRFAVVLLVNTDDYPNLDQAFVKAANLFFGITLADPPPPPARDPGSYAGTYVDSRGALGTIQIVVDQGKLYGEIPSAQFRTPLSPVIGYVFEMPLPTSLASTLGLGPSLAFTVYLDAAGRGKYLVTRSGVAVAQ
jgi:CubicO group peptidase (beta-lactamase class C family)